eukprot:COSAG01_NODE_27178_length_692_cov_1.156830_2_plen_64_part_01
MHGAEPILTEPAGHTEHCAAELHPNGSHDPLIIHDVPNGHLKGGAHDTWSAETTKPLVTSQGRH